MPASVVLLTVTLSAAGALAQADQCRLTPKEVVTRFVDELYIDRHPRAAFETWVEPGYIQHSPLAASGRDAAIAFLEPFFEASPGCELLDQASHPGGRSRAGALA